jgi:hypothetical protein
MQVALVNLQCPVCFSGPETIGASSSPGQSQCNRIKSKFPKLRPSFWRSKREVNVRRPHEALVPLLHQHRLSFGLRSVSIDLHGPQFGLHGELFELQLACVTCRLPCTFFAREPKVSSACKQTKIRGQKATTFGRRQDQQPRT